MNALDIAVDYIGRGWSPVPIPYRQKKPVLPGWQKLQVTEETAPEHFNGELQNVGIILGTASGDLVDVDLDCPEAAALASSFLPPTELAFGRPSKRRSHLLYTSAVPKVIQFQDPDPPVDKDGRPDKAMLVELRSNGGQTVFPGSTHESDEVIRWVEDGDPAEVDPTQLLTATCRLVAACLLLRAAPASDRHQYLLDICGAMVRELGRDGAAAILAPVARCMLGDLYRKAEGDRLLDDTARKIAEGAPVSGWPTLVERIGRKRASKVSEWLQITRGDGSGSTDRTDGDSTKGKSEPWDDPDMLIIRAHRHPAPPLPLAIFRPFWRNWIEVAAASKGAPPDFVAMSLLAAAGTMIANARRASPWPGWVEPPIIWQGNVGLPSSGKSPALDAITDIIDLLERELDSDFEDRRRDDLAARELSKVKREIWEAEVKTAVKKGLAPPDPPREVGPPPPPERKRLLTNNTTTERLAGIIATNDRALILFRDELAGWVGQMDKYGGNGADRAAYIEAYGGRPYVIDRVKDGASIRVPHFSVGILGGIQPDRLASMLLAGDDDGLAARFLFSWPDPLPPTRPHRAPDNLSALGALRWLLTLLPDQVNGAKLPRVIPLTPAAVDRLHEWRLTVAAMEDGAAGLFLSWLGKLPGMAVRIAITLECLWWSAQPLGTAEPTAISNAAVAAATELLNAYSIPMARRTFGEAALPEADRDAIALARWLLRQAPVPSIINARDLRHADALPTREAERYDTALAELVLANWVKPAPRNSRPRTRPEGLSRQPGAAGEHRCVTREFIHMPCPKRPKPPEMSTETNFGGKRAFRAARI